MELFPDRAVNAYLGYVLNDENGAIDKVAFLYPSRQGTISWTVEVQASRIQRSLDIDIVPLVAIRPRVKIRGTSNDGAVGESS